MAKRVSILTGLYRPARRVFHLFQPAGLRAGLAEVQLYRSVLPPGALCFDVGANVGLKSEALLAAGARVVAFEPNRQVLPELRARCGHHPKWTVVEAGLGSSAAIATLYVRASSAKSGFLRDWGESRVVATSHVPIVTLDAAIRQFGVPYYCKIDVEGWDLEVLLGLSHQLALISFEFHVTEQEIRKTRCCMTRLAELGATHVNLTLASGTTFQFTEWRTIGEFLDWFPGNLSGYGDIFVRQPHD